METLPKEIADMCGIVMSIKQSLPRAQREEPKSPLSIKLDAKAVITVYYNEDAIGWIDVTHINKYGKTYRALSAQTSRVLHCESLDAAKNFIMEEYI